MKRIFILCAFICSYLFLQAQPVNKEAFSLLDFNYPGLEQVKAHYDKGEIQLAAKALLEYYRQRGNINHPDIDPQKIKISKTEQKWADDALEHTFFVHYGYQPSFNYGKDINWQYWPVKDNELRWQLHRHKWFLPMGKAYRVSSDEKYAKEWIFQFMDWIKKNPLTKIEKDEYEMTGNSDIKGNDENTRFAWRPLETAHRLEDQTGQFLLFIHSAAFTPEFLTEFLVNYHKHAVHTLNNYSKEGNHLLFEAQRMVYAGAFFPEFKDAEAWRRSGIDILNREIKKQVYSDGGQYELDLHYHAACVNIFSKALRMATINGFSDEFPQTYIETMESMVNFYMNVCYPDYTNPCFSDAKRGDRESEIKNYQSWLKLFPDNEQIRYMASEGKEGKNPANLSKGFLKTGFFTFRDSWKKDATVMVVKAGPKGEWHCQPDNGTFELWFNGKNLFPDSGSYIYAGEGEVMKLRDWFRQTKVHNTLTLDNRNMETTQSITKLWQPEGDVQIVVTENPSYNNLRHRRSIFFVNHKYFVIADEAIGNATGEINLHFQLCDGKATIDSKNLSVTSDFNDQSNVKLQCFAPEGSVLKQEEGWYSTAYRKRAERTAVSFNTNKKDEKTIRYITVIYPTEESGKAPDVSAQFINESKKDGTLEIEVILNGQKQILSYEL